MGTQAWKRSGIAAATALAAAAGALATAPGAHAAGAPDPASGICVVKADGIRPAKLKVGVNIDNAKSSAARHARCGLVQRVVRGLAAEGAERPEKVARYRCTPTVTGAKVAWTCRFRGGHPRTTIELDFAYRYTASDTRRG